MWPEQEQLNPQSLTPFYYNPPISVYHWTDVSPLQFHPMLNGSLPCFEIANAHTGMVPPLVKNNPLPGYCSSDTNTGSYSCLSASFHLIRQFSYYLVQIYVPSTLLVIVSWVSFWLDRSAVPARVTLGVTTLLTITTQVILQ